MLQALDILKEDNVFYSTQKEKSKRVKSLAVMQEVFIREFSGELVELVHLRDLQETLTYQLSSIFSFGVPSRTLSTLKIIYSAYNTYRNESSMR